MKAYTDIKQSKKLAEILPIESADMRYGYIAPYDYSDRMYDGGYDEIPYPKDFLIKNPNFSANEYEAELPCWSLAALFNVLPFCLTVDNKRYGFSMLKGLDKNGETYAIKYAIFNTTFYLHLTDFYNNPVDACVEMILKLHKEKLL